MSQENKRDSSQSIKYISASVERLCACTELFSREIVKDSLSYKKKLEEQGTKTLSLLCDVRFARVTRLEDTLDQLVSELLALQMLFRVGMQARIVSPMNYEIIAQQISDTVSLIHQQSSAFAHVSSFRQVTLQPFFAGVADLAESDSMFPRSVTEPSQPRAPVDDQGQKTYSGENKSVVSSSATAHPTTKSPVSDQSQKKKRDRRSIILSLLQEKDRISVKDVSERIVNCSEKTLQRELLSMVDQGLLRKEGERRWSTYLLAS